MSKHRNLEVKNQLSKHSNYEVLHLNIFIFNSLFKTYLAKLFDLSYIQNLEI